VAMIMKKIVIIFFIFLYSFYLSAVDKKDVTDDKIYSYIEELKEILEYGIDSEVIAALKDTGDTLRDDLFPKVLERYKKVRVMQTKIEFVNFFGNLKNNPQYVIDALYEDASGDYVDKQINIALINTLAKIGGEREAKLIISRLDSEDNAIRMTAADAISRMKIKEVSLLILERLKLAEDDPEKYLVSDIKSKLILYFGEVKATEALEYLRKVAADKNNDKFIIMYAMLSLAKIGDLDSLDIIEKNLENSEVKIQEYAGYALSLFENPSVIPKLKNMALHNNEQVRIYACQGLSKNKDPSAISLLVFKFKKDSSAKVRRAALQTLLEYGDIGVKEVKEFYKNIKMTDAMLSDIASIVSSNPNDDSVQYLVELYNNANDKGKEAIAKAIGFPKSNKIDPIVKLMLQSPNFLIRMGGIKALTLIKDTSLWDIIIDMSKNDKVEAVRKYAQKLLDLY